MEATDKMYGLSSFFEGAEKLLEIWFGNDDQYGETLDEFDDYQNLSSIIRISEDEDDEKMSNSDSGEDESIFYNFKQQSTIDKDQSIESDALTVLDNGGKSSKSKDTADLRRIPREALEQLLQIVKCEIISSRKNEFIDSYVLSESSMFIAKNRFLIKTCGNTVLLKCLKPLLYLVREYTSFDKVRSDRAIINASPEINNNLFRSHFLLILAD